MLVILHLAAPSRRTIVHIGCFFYTRDQVFLREGRADPLLAGRCVCPKARVRDRVEVRGWG